MRRTVVDDLLASIPDGVVRDIRVGAFWTAVVAEVEGGRRCGLASNLHREGHCHSGGTGVGKAGTLLERGARELAELARSRSLMEASIGVATINALLPRDESAYVDLNAEEVIGRHGEGKRVAVVGNFPFIPRLRERVATLSVFEEDPHDGCLPAEAEADVIPRADVVAVTGAALVNHTLDELIALRRPGSLLLILGPSTPLSPVLYDHGADFLSGSLVEKVDAVVAAVCQGGNFRQIRRRGVRLVTMRPPLRPFG
jgi:uncharacterized protein (DUF4213/DUF364 family)